MGLINRFPRFFDDETPYLTQLIESGSLGDQIVVFIRVSVCVKVGVVS